DGSRVSLGSPGMTAEILLPPGLERLVEGALARRALFQRENGAAAVVVDDRNVEPAALLQELQVALHVAFDRRQPDEEEARRHLDGDPRERRTTRLLRLLHQDPGHVRDAAERKIGRQVERDLDRMARRERLIGI